MSKYWFKRRRYGYGWFPSSWQGWLTGIIYVFAIVLASKLIGNNTTGLETALFMLYVLVATLVFIAISLRKGPKPKWRWGRRPENNPDEDW